MDPRPRAAFDGAHRVAGAAGGGQAVPADAAALAADAAGLGGDGARLRFHDLRHTFASHLIIDLGLDVVQVSWLMGHASPSTTLNIYAHMFDEARHAADIRARMARSAFAGLLDTDEDVAHRDHSPGRRALARGAAVRAPKGRDQVGNLTQT